MAQQTVYNGRYELHRQLARGGMADVFLARDQLLDRPVAVKVLFPEFATDPSFVERFRREAQAAANLNHPNIVSVFDWGQESGTYFIVMEYVDGRSLADILRTEGPLHPDRAAEIVTDIAAALGFAHRNGVIHRDIKPGNVIISPSGQVKVADFGIARALNAGAEANLTQTGAVMGTATYFSPEQAQGLNLDPRSDLYSLGVVLYEMLTGRPPFGGDSPVTIAYKHVQEQPTPPRHVNLDIPLPLEAVTMKLLAKNPANRYASAEDLRADLRRFREGQQVHAEGVLTGPAATAAVPAVASTQAVRAYNDGTRMIPAEELPREYQPPRRSGAFLVVLIVLLLLLAGLLVALAKVLGVGDSPDVAQVTVPGVIGQDVDAARATLQGQGFVVETTFVENDTVPENIVVEQDPTNGEKVDEGSTVTLTVSSGVGAIDVPLVVGQQVADATALLTDAGFIVVNKDQADDEKPVGEVLAQDPAGNTKAPKGSTITLTVSSGPEARAVPDVTGKSVAEASNLLGQAGFKVTQSSEASSTVAEGKVIRTDPPAGTTLPKDSTVNLVVSSGPPMVEVPSVVGLSSSTATSQLQAKGFQVDVQEVEVIDPAQDGVVQEQDPAGGTSAAEGSTVTITVGKLVAAPSSSTTSTTA